MGFGKRTEMSEKEKWYAENLAFLKKQKSRGIIGLIKKFFMFIFYIIPIIGWIAFFKRPHTISEEEFDNRVQQQVEITKKKSADFLGIDGDQIKDVKPIIFNQYTRYRTNYSKDLAFRTLIKYDDERKMYRASDYQTTYIAFSDKQIFVYQCQVSMIESSIFKRAFEYFYQDIVTVEVERAKYTQETIAEATARKGFFGIFGGLSRKMKRTDGVIEEIEFDCFHISTVGAGETFTAVFKNTPEVRDSISGMKQLIRERKAKASK